jgi:hypothetical protein
MNMFNKNEPEGISAEPKRDEIVYRYLLTLTDLSFQESKIQEKPGKSYSITSIAEQWGMDRMFITRVMKNIIPNELSNQYSPSPKLDIDKLVEILSSLRSFRIKNNKVKKISRLEITKALRLFAQLSANQEEKLGLSKNGSQILLQQLDDNINELDSDLIPEIVKKIYGFLLEGKFSGFERGDASKINLGNKKEDEEKYIKQEIRNIMTQLPAGIVNKYYRKIILEKKKIEAESGLDAFEFFHDPKQEKVVNSRRISRSTLQILIKSVIDNEILTDELPIYIKYIEINKNRGLPLFLDDTNNVGGVLNNDLQKGKSQSEMIGDIQSLKNLFSYTVKVHFYIRVENYSSELAGKDKDLSIDNHPSGGKCINFFEEVTGVGSPLSHIIAAINRILLWDIPLLKDYVPIAKNIIIDTKVLGHSSNSTIWGHNVICLCKSQDVNYAMKNNKPYDKYFNTQDYASGDYCGFDLLEVAGKAAFYARLRAIKQTGLSSKQYIEQVIDKIREISAFRKAKNMLHSYPFSKLEMEYYIENSIFKYGEYRRKDVCKGELDFGEDANDWSLVAYQAHLSIAEAYLKEGLYKVGKKYLDVLQKHLIKNEGTEPEIKDGIDPLIVSKYYLSMFRYYYLRDESNDQSQAKEMLKEGKKCFELYVSICHAIDELPHVNFYNSFYIMSRICAHEAKLYLFKNRNEDMIKGNLEEALYQFEKARIYAARDGDSALYSIWSAYQSWCYVMRAYLSDSSQKEHSLKWADKILKHALVCYSEKGRACYEEIKANSGKEKESKDHSKISIEPIPLIQETIIPTGSIGFNDDRTILTIDMSIFSWEYSKDFGQGNNKNTYLFGVQSTILLFARGMIKLCQDNDELLKEIEVAEKYFNYSWNIAEEQLQINNDGQSFRRGYKCSEDKMMQEYLNEFSIGSLYPHRFTQFADLGKIFAIVCLVIVSKYKEKKTSDDDMKINFLISRLKGDNFNDPTKVFGQKSYNVHLKEVYEKFAEYIRQFRSEKVESDITTLRNNLVSKVFTIILARKC